MNSYLLRVTGRINISSMLRVMDRDRFFVLYDDGKFNIWLTESIRQRSSAGKQYLKQINHVLALMIMLMLPVSIGKTTVE